MDRKYPLCYVTGLSKIWVNSKKKTQFQISWMDIVSSEAAVIRAVVFPHYPDGSDDQKDGAEALDDSVKDQTAGINDVPCDENITKCIIYTYNTHMISYDKWTAKFTNIYEMVGSNGKYLHQTLVLLGTVSKWIRK